VTPEPVQRYLDHAMPHGAPLHSGALLAMRGRIKVGRWLSFDARQELRGDAFTWQARAGLGRFRPLRVTDGYADGSGSTEGIAFGRIRFLHASGEDTSRAAAGRAAAESMWVPQTLLPSGGVRWRAESDTAIVATMDVPPERPDVRFEIDPATGALRSVSLMRWGNVGQDHFGYIPFGGTIHAEQRFGDMVLPSRVTVGWWFATPRYEPFFEATILSAEPIE
jgi:Family of unknown function (DUF6920)